MAGHFKLITDEHWSKAHVNKRSQPEITDWIKSGRTLPGVIIGVERRKRITPGRFLRFLQELAAEDVPFAGIIRFVVPEEK